MSDFAPGDIFAGHRIESVAGRGGMGVVYRAMQLDLDRPVALKVITPSLAQDEIFRDRFVRESRAAASIDHPNVIPIYYAGENGGVLYIAMRFVEGPDLRSLVRAHDHLGPERAARLTTQVGAALDAAHARGIVHRDVKPENVLLSIDDHPYLTDFGLTKRVDSLGGGQTRPGGWVGTLGYVAPEQIRGERVDARADVYALGCLLVFMLTGHAPFRRETEEATLWAHLSEEPPKVSGDVPGLPPAFDAVVARALAKEPADRFQSAGDLGRAALAAAGIPASEPHERSVATGAAAWSQASTAAEGEGVTLPAGGPPTGRQSPTPVHPTPPTDNGPASPARSRRPWLIGAGAAVLLAGVAAALAVALGGGDGGSGSGTAPVARTASASSAPVSTEVGGRPNGIALAGGLAWVLRNPLPTLATIDERTAKQAPWSPGVGSEPSAITAAFGKLWVANPGLARLIPIDEATHRQDGAAAPLPPGRPVTVAADDRWLWVGQRSFGGATLAKVDPRKRTVVTVRPLPYGVQALTAGNGAVWVLERDKRQVVRIDVSDGSRRAITVGREPRGIAFGAGAVWVTNSADDTVTKIDAGSLNTSIVSVGTGPEGIAVGDGAVWVANRVGNTLTRIDPGGASAPRTVTLPAQAENPYAIAAGSGFVWVTSPPRAAVTRVTAP